MLQSLINNIALFNRYIGLLPENTTHQKYLWFLYAMKHLCAGFRVVQARIQRHIRSFENETRVTVDELTVQGVDEFRTRLPQQIPSDDG